MEFNKPVTNPMLVGAIELLKAEDTPDHRQLFMDEVMKAAFLIPAEVSPAPEPDQEGKVRLTPANKIQFPMLSAPDGKRFFMAFTDWTELKKWKDEEGQQTFVVRFKDYADMLFRKDAKGNVNPAGGFVINPYGGNIVITRELAASFIAASIQRSQGQGGLGHPAPPERN
ncbi:MAG: SseB family protein [Candidatus Gastranaerophilales bacterium]|nr:SseB family protein [Candidatus Gastranaerophilales bacterium]